MNTTQQKLEIEKEFLSHEQYINFSAWCLTKNKEQALDLAQEVYYKAFRRIDFYKPDSNSKAYLARILRNEFINTLRDKKKGASISLELSNDHSGAIKDPDEIDFDLIGEEYSPEIKEAMANLPKNALKLIILRDIEEFSYTEIAEILGLPLGTIKSNINRARMLMRMQLSDYARESGIGKNAKIKRYCKLLNVN